MSAALRVPKWGNSLVIRVAGEADFEFDRLEANEPDEAGPSDQGAD